MAFAQLMLSRTASDEIAMWKQTLIRLITLGRGHFLIYDPENRDCRWCVQQKYSGEEYSEVMLECREHINHIDNMTARIRNERASYDDGEKQSNHYWFNSLEKWATIRATYIVIYALCAAPAAWRSSHHMLDIRISALCSRRWVIIFGFLVWKRKLCHIQSIASLCIRRQETTNNDNEVWFMWLLFQAVHLFDVPPLFKRWQLLIVYRGNGVGQVRLTLIHQRWTGGSYWNNDKRYVCAIDGWLAERLGYKHM